MTAEGHLTNAGLLAFVGRGDPCLDYRRRDHAGADSLQRLRQSNRSLIEEVTDAFQAVSVHNKLRHLPAGLAIGQVRELPELAVREAIVNGVVHREWGLKEPTVIEHVGRTLVVTSPGGFVGGVNRGNIITHPSQARNRALAELFAALRIAEREGIGVDRMVREMVRLGYSPPDIDEISGPYVRAALVGDKIDVPWIRFLRRLQPPNSSQDLNALLILSHLCKALWIDLELAMPILQRSRTETEGAIASLASVSIDGSPVMALVAGIPAGDLPAWHLTTSAVNALTDLDPACWRSPRSAESRS